MSTLILTLVGIVIAAIFARLQQSTKAFTFNVVVLIIGIAMGTVLSSIPNKNANNDTVNVSVDNQVRSTLMHSSSPAIMPEGENGEAVQVLGNERDNYLPTTVGFPYSLVPRTSPYLDDS